MKKLLDRFLEGGNKGFTYEESRELAGHADADVRRELADHEDTKPEILYFLTDDPSPAVRAAIAKNKSTPHQADLRLAKDKDDNVRGDLARKIALIAPHLNANDQDKVKAMAYEALDILARDQVTRVRQVVSETLKDIAGAPPEVIRTLAWDAEIIVAGPVLEYSPVLTDEDLLEIITHGTATGQLSAISKRQNVSESVVDALVETSNVEAIGLLLGNDSAQIREETLDRVINEAREVESWHFPLVARPHLSLNAAKKLASFVADNLLKKMTARTDFPPEVMTEVRKVVERRLDIKEADKVKEVEKVDDSDTPLELAVAEVEKLDSAGELNEKKILSAVKKGHREFVIAALALRAEVRPIAMEKVFRNKSPKGIVAASWKAGLSAKTAEIIQRDMANLDAENILKAQSGEFPLSEGDLEWQFEVISEVG
jgi:uncharacterized protein (DUF2336 family)